RNELLALRVWDVDTGISREAWPALWKQTLREGLAESSFRRKDGVLVPVEVSATDLEVGGRRLRVKFVRDVTERRAVMDDMRRTPSTRGARRSTGCSPTARSPTSTRPRARCSSTRERS